ncbi:hypothetical protein [Flexithrix dorotheae]|uniref:hypothetical protein n=1 Tax=Flexithrix dorotheae TaxID=70993 RepID=UPI0003732537|nr:hypothetical protein [Flexithrix dorotheae]
MKKSKFFKLFFILGLVTFALTNCDEEPESEKSCSQDEICTSKNVTACCDDMVCVYEYDGKEYQEDELDQLAEDLGCSSSSGGRFAASGENDQVKDQLLNLLMRAKDGLR